MKNKKANTIWKRNARLISLKRLREIRLSIGVPEEGFKTESACEKWEKENLKIVKALDDEEEKKNNYQNFIKTNSYKLQNYIKEINLKYPEIAIGYDKAIENIILFNEVPDWIIEKCNATGCSIEIKGGHKKDMDDGVYIKISPHTSIQDIKIFLLNAGRHLPFYKELVYGQKNERFRKENFGKNELVYNLSKHSLDELKLLYTDTFGGDIADVEHLRSADTVACSIMKKIGLIIKPDNYRRILSRVRKRRKLT